ncbi:MAG TPA: BTAD domain-containing putative transcriptional regulator [Nocardioides sp.]|nr:BTAD domain-containing putative transcriptional regulator [Nocardioides sp.]
MESEENTRLHLGLLGGFQVTFAGEPTAVSRAGQRLLAMLAVVHGQRPTSRAAIAERLWVDVSPERAASSLRSTLWRLPRPRGRVFVVCDATTVRLAEDLDVDLWQTEALARGLCAGSGAVSASDGDLEALSDDLLPSWYDEWLDVARESHRQNRLHALERSSRDLREQRRFPQALTAALGAVRSEPLRESAHRRVIEVHLTEGNKSEALRQYDRYRRLLAHELGLTPSPAIRRLVAPLLGRPDDARSLAE